MVFLVDLLLWVCRSERLGAKESLSLLLDRLGNSDRVPLYLVWSFQPVELVEGQVFGLDRLDGTDEAEAILSGVLRYRWRPSVSLLLSSEPIRKSLPDGVSPGRSAAIFRFRRELQDAFSVQDVEDIAGFIDVEDGVHMMSVQRSQWRIMAIRSEDACALWGDGWAEQPTETYEALVALAVSRKKDGKRKPIPWKSHPEFADLAWQRKQMLSRTMGAGEAEKLIAEDLGISVQALRYQFVNLKRSTRKT